MSLKWNQIGVSFLIGLLIGTVVASSPLRRKFHKDWDKKTHHERMLERFSTRLNLSPDQKTQIGKILEGKRARVEKIFADSEPKFEQIRKETNDEIRKLLNPDQQEKFATLEAEMRERFKKRMAKHH